MSQKFPRSEFEKIAGPVARRTALLTGFLLMAIPPLVGVVILISEMPKVAALIGFLFVWFGAAYGLIAFGAKAP